MQSDLPHTLYKSKKESTTKQDVDEAEQAMLEAIERKRKRMEEEERKRTEESGYTIEELFAGKDLESEPDNEIIP